MTKRRSIEQRYRERERDRKRKKGHNWGVTFTFIFTFLSRAFCCSSVNPTLVSTFCATRGGMRRTLRRNQPNNHFEESIMLSETNPTRAMPFASTNPRFVRSLRLDTSIPRDRDTQRKRESSSPNRFFLKGSGLLRSVTERVKRTMDALGLPGRTVQYSEVI